MRCNTIVIGVVVTEFVSGMIATPEARAALTSVHPTTRLGEPPDVAKLTGNQIKSAVRADH